MANEDTEQSPWTRPGFVGAAVVVAIVLVLAVVLGIGALGNGSEPEPAPEPTVAEPTPEPTTPEPTPFAGESVCGLEGVELDGTVTTAVPATWEFQGTTAYPSSDEFGPAAQDVAGVRYCFQHSPQGALVAAANALVQAADPTVSSAWAEQFLSSGPHRDTLLAEAQATSTASGANVRLNIAGFRVLEYTGEAATVDIAVEGSADGTPVVGSFIYDLVWEAGDWKLDASSAAPFNFAAIPDLTGYIAWGA